MSTMTLSAKRQVVLPADLCRQVALAPGARVQVELAPDGSGIVVRPSVAGGRKPASVLFGRVVRRGKAVPVEELQGLAVAKKEAKAGKR
jgi:bifunctional DNA-binding transcriptional regulator/antitoxin component of YhaV-PrlF toxin-antitoxin module